MSPATSRWYRRATKPWLQSTSECESHEIEGAEDASSNRQWGKLARWLIPSFPAANRPRSQHQQKCPAGPCATDATWLAERHRQPARRRGFLSLAPSTPTRGRREGPAQAHSWEAFGSSSVNQDASSLATVSSVAAGLPRLVQPDSSITGQK